MTINNNLIFLMRLSIPLLLTALFIAANVFTHVVRAENIISKADPGDAKQVLRGEIIYRRFCSLCHGKDLEGQADWRIRKADGKLPAPPHDETGHTWHHPDHVLFAITKNGLVPPNAPPDYKTDMPAWKDTLKDNDIWAVLAYIKSRWPEETRQKQQEINSSAK